jgi:16S rRNA (cytosine1402-N4)-methyltransferase
MSLADSQDTWFEHQPVLLQACLDTLIIDKDGLYLDGTLGGGGHTKAILAALSSEAIVFGLDQDAEAHKAAAKRIGSDERFKPIKGNFAHMQTLLGPEYYGKLSGILLDLGVSTHQLKAAERGFSHKFDGPLDMRMSDLSVLTAKMVVNDYSRDQLADVLYQYGEERLSRLIADAIVAARPLERTEELKQVVESVVKGRFAHKSLARVFQGIRIEVNQELQVLEEVLNQSAQLLKEGGRLCVISYHSLEDRMVKRFLKTGSFEGKENKDLFGKLHRPFKPLQSKVITPDENEIAQNKASRSAKLRIGVKNHSKDA